MEDSQVADILGDLLVRVELEGMRDYMSSFEIADWMARELRSRGIQVIG